MTAPYGGGQPALLGHAVALPTKVRV